MKHERRRRRLACVVLLIHTWLEPAVADAADCSFHAPVERPYRVEPDEDALALAALLGHFTRHPYSDEGDACVTLPGYRPPTAAVTVGLTAAGIKLSSDPHCRFGEGRLVWSVAGVWRLEAGALFVHVTKLKFADVSVFVEGYEYTLARRKGQWVIDTERQSPCNAQTPRA